jgi:hypothetical protein
MKIVNKCYNKAYFAMLQHLARTGRTLCPTDETCILSCPEKEEGVIGLSLPLSCHEDHYLESSLGLLRQREGQVRSDVVSNAFSFHLQTTIMPPSPPPDRPERESPPRRAASLPPELIRRKRSSTLTSVFKKMRIEAQESGVEAGTVDIEELSPEAIIPDSMTIMRDPEIEIHDDDEARRDRSVEDKSTGIDVDGIDGVDGEDTSADGEEDEFLNVPPPPRLPKKRKFNLNNDDDNDERQRKRTVSPGLFSPARGYG